MILETNRLLLREFASGDADFFLRLVSSEEYKRGIYDTGITTLQQAKNYIEETLTGLYRKFGFGLWVMCEKSTGCPVGMAGIISRDYLPEVDLGYALLPEYFRRGLAFEACQAVCEYARSTLNRPQILAVVSPNNLESIALLQKLGFVFVGTVKPSKGKDILNQYAKILT
ncbi:MAG: GNAT family N-acetyltransferase [Candidatus Cloacimonetes bacterium]|nr:GNAT family N-acetyltransferase [Candidatus Cloacimonadota bacterium]